MNLKAEKFKAYIAENNITNFKVEESINNNEEENTRVTFHTYVKVFGQKYLCYFTSTGNTRH